MTTLFIKQGVYGVKIKHRDGGYFWAPVHAGSHAEAARKCLPNLAKVWSES